MTMRRDYGASAVIPSTLETPRDCSGLRCTARDPVIFLIPKHCFGQTRVRETIHAVPLGGRGPCTKRLGFTLVAWETRLRNLSRDRKN